MIYGILGMDAKNTVKAVKIAICIFWIAKGINVYIKDGKTYNIPKAYQRVMALKSELQNPLIYRESDIKIQPRCKTCKRRNSCNGCRWCGKCN